MKKQKEGKINWSKNKWMEKQREDTNYDRKEREIQMNGNTNDKKINANEKKREWKANEMKSKDMRFAM